MGSVSDLCKFCTKKILLNKQIITNFTLSRPYDKPFAFNMKLIKKIQRDFVNYSIGFMVILIAGNGLLDFSNRRAQASHEALMDEALELEVSMTSVLRALNNSDMGFRGFYIIPTEQLLHPYTEAVVDFPQHTDNVKRLMKQHGLEPSKIDPVSNTFQEYFALIGQMVDWRR